MLTVLDLVTLRPAMTIAGIHIPFRNLATLLTSTGITPARDQAGISRVSDLAIVPIPPARMLMVIRGIAPQPKWATLL